MTDFSDISIVVPVREGSSRVREKIFLPFGDETTLLEWKIEQLKQVQRPDRIFLSSNSERVAAVARSRQPVSIRAVFATRQGAARGRDRR